jgi:hypothetical protein
MSQSAVARSSQGLFLVQKAPLNRVAARYAGKRPGPVLVTWTSEPKPQPKKGQRALALLSVAAAPLGWIGHALFASHRG